MSILSSPKFTSRQATENLSNIQLLLWVDTLFQRPLKLAVYLKRAQTRSNTKGKVCKQVVTITLLLDVMQSLQTDRQRQN